VKHDGCASHIKKTFIKKTKETDGCASHVWVRMSKRVSEGNINPNLC
jgi:sulfur transfer protein SufE